MAAIQAFSYLRMSTPEQIKGDSLRRQLELSQAFAAEHGLELVEDLRDIGVSGFRGANAEVGALSQFLDAIEKKKVPKGSFLLVESIDRLSRQKLWRTIGILSDIINAGVKIVSLANEKVIDDEGGLEDMLMPLIEAARAHSESKNKSLRNRAAWEAKLKLAREKGIPITKQAPSWLRINDVGTGFEQIPDHVKIVKRIFKMAASGSGISVITQILNREKIPSLKSGGDWYDSYINGILKSRAVLGEFQPVRIIDGETVSDGPLLPTYFPRIIDDETFYAVQHCRELRRKGGGGAGRMGANVGNLFAKLATCGECGAPLHIVSRGYGSGKVLACKSVKIGTNASTHSRQAWKYDHFERSFLSFVREIGLSTTLTTDAARHERDELEQQIKATEGKLAKANSSIDLLLDSGGASASVKTKLQDLGASVSQLEKQLEEQKTKRETLSRESDAFAASQTEISSLIDKVQATGGDTLLLRSTLQARIRDLVERVRVRMGASAEALGGRHFIVYFRDDTRRVVYPDPADPTRFVGIGHTTDGIITDGKVRWLLACYGFTTPTRAEYDEMVADLAEAGRFRWALGVVGQLSATGDEALAPLHMKWESRRVGPDQSATVMAEFKARRADER